MNADSFVFEQNPYDTPMHEFADPMDSGTITYDPDTLYGGRGEDTVVYPVYEYDPDAANRLADEHMPQYDGFFLG